MAAAGIGGMAGMAKSKLLNPALDRTTGADAEVLNESTLAAESKRRAFLSQNPSQSNTGSIGPSQAFSDDELERACSDALSGVDLGGAEPEQPEQPSGSLPDGRPVVELPVLEPKHIEAGLVFVHEHILAPKYGDHWRLSELNKKALVPALDKWLMHVQGKAENLLGTWLTRWAGEHRETAGLMLVLAVVYLPKVRETIKLNAEKTDGAAIATTTTESAE